MLSWCCVSNTGVLADEMGLGKTVQTVALVAALAQYKGCTGPHLVLAPKAVLPNWVRTSFNALLCGAPSCDMGRGGDPPIVMQLYMQPCIGARRCP